MVDSPRPLCFVLMPFGMKKDPSGGPDINFDDIYDKAIRPGIEDAEMEPIRADEERTGGIIHKAMFERLLLCEFAVADLTTANANVFYELGVRHAIRPATTLGIFASNQKPPFDVGFLRALPYELAERNRFSSREAALLRQSLAKRLVTLREDSRDGKAIDSPIFQLLTDYAAPDLAHLKTDLFRDSVNYSVELKRQLATARDNRNLAALTEIENHLGRLDNIEAGVLVDLFLSYRALSAWKEMIQLYERLSSGLQRTVMVREQYAMALNRDGNRAEAMRILQSVVDENGPSSETCGLMGRVAKDLWSDANKSGNDFLAAGYLDQAIANYVKGFEADWRDAYPGINAVTLLDIKGDEHSQKQKAELLPVVLYAVTQRLKSGRPDYWDHATLLELAVLDSNWEKARTHLAGALAAVREPWEPTSTANNLNLIRDARQKRGSTGAELDQIIAALNSRAA